ncbi:MAG: hypothetical protein M1491_01560 [Deltaproteobacteria bacterium]|nr:hypothetical protein [Deltaproteobacteria bacterium]MCL5277745.1 hypothetical protein [Deltaproteobacteria bacterium]
MKTKAFSKLIILGLLAMVVMAGCSGSKGATGATGSTGATGGTGTAGPAGPLSPSPVITGLNPTMASFNTVITITGENFTASPTVYCDGSPAMLTSYSATQISVIGCGNPSSSSPYQASMAVLVNKQMSNAINEWVVPSGYITQFPAASLTGPQGVVYDSATGKLYVADNAGVFAVDNATGWTTKIVPATTSCASCTLADPAGITMDNNGNLIVTDSYNNTVVGINPTTSNVWYVIKPGNSLLNAPVGVTYSNGYLYVANSGSSTITKINTTTLIAANLTLSLALPSAPYGIAADGSGYLYVACKTNNTISKIVVTGLIGAVTNSYVTGITGPYGIGISGTSMLVTRAANSTLYTAPLATGGAASAMCAVFGSASHQNSSVIPDGSGGLFVGAPSDGLVYHVNSACNTSTYAAGFAGSYDTGFAQGDIYAVNDWFGGSYGDAILEIRSDGAMKVLAQIEGRGASVIANPTGNITVGSWGGSVINVSSTGVTSTVFPLGTFNSGASGLAYDNSGNLFINNCGTIAKWDGTTLTPSFATGTHCYQMAYHNGNLYVSVYNSPNGRIDIVNASTGGPVSTYVPASAFGPNGLEGIGFDMFGDIIVVDDGYNALFRVDPLGHVTALVPSATSPMNCPNGIGIAPSQLIYTDEECGGTSARMWVIAP